jgi:hypothetical protein
VLTSGARWENIDKKKYPSYQTCHRYFQQWVRSGVFHNALLVLSEELEDQGLLRNCTKVFWMAASFRLKRGDAVGLTKRGKGNRIMAVVDANGLPMGLRVCTAGEHEVKQVQDTVLERGTVALPERTIARIGLLTATHWTNR